MKNFLIFTVLLLVPSVSSALFIEDFQGQESLYRIQRVAPAPVAETVLGWPSWIGRLDDFSLLLFGRRYENLTRGEQVEVRELSQEWPEWIGVPRSFR